MISVYTQEERSALYKIDYDARQKRLKEEAARQESERKAKEEAKKEAERKVREEAAEEEIKRLQEAIDKAQQLYEDQSLYN